MLDVEPPEIFCPDNITVSCEVALDPANTGDPTTIDNCAIGNLTKADQRIDGACANDYTVKRTWTAVDVHFNMSTCMQVIKVEDKTSPSITCPSWSMVL